MTILGKKQMSEEDIKLNYITPVILKGWKGHITMETKITDGRINIRGNIVARSKPKFADYNCASEILEQQQLMKNLQKNSLFLTQQMLMQSETNYILQILAKLVHRMKINHDSRLRRAKEG